MLVEGVVRVSSSGFVIEVARDGRLHADGREAVGLDAALFGLGLRLVGGIEVQTDEQIGVNGIGECHPVGQRDIDVSCARKIYRPAAGLEEAFQAKCPIQRKLLLVTLGSRLIGAKVVAPMTGIEHDDPVGLQQQGGAKRERGERLGQVKLKQTNRTK